MALARFFERIHAAAGRHLALDRASLAAALGERVVAIHCGPEVETENENPRWLAEFLVNLFARLYPRLAISGSESVVKHLEQLARAINPAIEVVTGPASATVVVGRAESPPEGALHPRADGWVARLLRAPDPAHWGPTNPYAAAAAASLAAAEVFRIVFRDRMTSPLPERDVHLSLLDFGEDAGAARPLVPAHLGEVAFLGLGAVCNAALWTLGRHPGLEAEGWLVDPETVDLSNFQRYVLTVDADENRPNLTSRAARSPARDSGSSLASTRSRASRTRTPNPLPCRRSASRSTTSRDGARPKRSCRA